MENIKTGDDLDNTKDKSKTPSKIPISKFRVRYENKIRSERRTPRIESECNATSSQCNNQDEEIWKTPNSPSDNIEESSIRRRIVDLQDVPAHVGTIVDLGAPANLPIRHTINSEEIDIPTMNLQDDNNALQSKSETSLLDLRLCIPDEEESTSNDSTLDTSKDSDSERGSSESELLGTEVNSNKVLLGYWKILVHLLVTGCGIFFVLLLVYIIFRKIFFILQQYLEWFLGLWNP